MGFLELMSLIAVTLCMKTQQLINLLILKGFLKKTNVAQTLAKTTNAYSN